VKLKSKHKLFSGVICMRIYSIACLFTLLHCFCSS